MAGCKKQVSQGLQLFMFVEYKSVQKFDTASDDVGGCGSMLISRIRKHEEKIWPTGESPCL